METKGSVETGCRGSPKRTLETKGSPQAEGTTWTEAPALISHIVLFQPKPGLKSVEILGFAQQLHATMRSIGTVRRAMVGRRIDVNSGEDRSFGDSTYEYSAVVEFDDQAGLVSYLNEPAHRELGRLFWLYCERTVVLEVQAVDAKSTDVVDLLVDSQKK